GPASGGRTSASLSPLGPLASSSSSNFVQNPIWTNKSFHGKRLRSSSIRPAGKHKPAHLFPGQACPAAIFPQRTTGPTRRFHIRFPFCRWTAGRSRKSFPGQGLFVQVPFWTKLDELDEAALPNRRSPEHVLVAGQDGSAGLIQVLPRALPDRRPV